MIDPQRQLHEARMERVRQVQEVREKLAKEALRKERERQEELLEANNTLADLKLQTNEEVARVTMENIGMEENANRQLMEQYRKCLGFLYTAIEIRRDQNDSRVVNDQITEASHRLMEISEIYEMCDKYIQNHFALVAENENENENAAAIGGARDSFGDLGQQVESMRCHMNGMEEKLVTVQRDDEEVKRLTENVRRAIAELDDLKSLLPDLEQRIGAEHLWNNEAEYNALKKMIEIISSTINDFESLNSKNQAMIEHLGQLCIQK